MTGIKLGTFDQPYTMQLPHHSCHYHGLLALFFIPLHWKKTINESSIPTPTNQSHHFYYLLFRKVLSSAAGFECRLQLITICFTSQGPIQLNFRVRKIGSSCKMIIASHKDGQYFTLERWNNGPINMVRNAIVPENFAQFFIGGFSGNQYPYLFFKFFPRREQKTACWLLLSVAAVAVA